MKKINNILLAMISMRVLSSLIEMSAAILMYNLNSVKSAIRINAVLGLIGPIILIIVTFLGLIEISQQISIKNILLISIGVILIILGTR